MYQKQQCPKGWKILLNGCEVRDVEREDDGGEERRGREVKGISLK